MARQLTAKGLIEEVRSVLDENNENNVDDEKDILPALNRAQDYASSILSRHYESPMLTNTMVTMVSGQTEYDIPEDAFEQRLEKIEILITDSYYPVKRIDYRDITLYDIPSRTNTPDYYCVIGNKFKLLPGPTAAYPIRLWYLKDPDPLVQEQGRITHINTGSNYIIVEDIGSDLTTDMTDLNSYINIVDSQTGILKVSLQIQSIQGNKITFKSSPTRTTVMNKTVSGAIPTTVEVDDLICVSQGNCVPFFKKPFSNFLIQYAVAEITRKLGGPADMEYKVLDDLRDQVKHSWAGREQSLRVKKINKTWAVPNRRYFKIN